MSRQSRHPGGSISETDPMRTRDWIWGLLVIGLIVAIVAVLFWLSFGPKAI